MEKYTQYIKKVLFIVGENKTKLLLVFLLFLSTLFLELLGIGLVAPYISLLNDPGQSQFFIEQFQLDLEKESLILLVSIIFAMIFILKSFLVILANKSLIEFGYFNGVRIRLILLRSYQSMPYHSFLKRNSSEYIYRIENLAGSFSQGSLIVLVRVFSEILISISILFFLIWVNGYQILYAIIFFAVIVSSYLKFFRDKLIIFGKLSNENSTNMVQVISESMNGIKDIRLLKKEDYFLRSLERKANAFAMSKIKANIISLIPRYLLELILVLAVIGFIIVSVYTGYDLENVLTLLSTLAVASLRLFPSLNQIVNGITKIRFSQNTVNVLYNDLKDLPQNINKSEEDYSKKEIKKFKSLELKNISFAYSHSDNPIINDISFKINSGEVVGLIGESGSGKTTLINIILGLLKPTRGNTIVNGVSTKSLLKTLEGQVAYLPQKAFLIDDTLEKNIALGEDEEFIDMVKLESAIEKACLKDVVENLPQKLKTNIGESGIRMSGGQQQRVALARAFYYSKSILVMDESTSAVDKVTEEGIIDEIEKIKGDTTVIIISHRLSSLKHCDCIYEIDKGKLREYRNSSQNF